MSLLLSSLSAQNYRPINSSDRYNFQETGADYISQGIWVTSIGVVNGDSVFSLNRIVERAYDCLLATNNEATCDSCCFVANQPQFLQREMIALPGGVYQFNDPDTLVLEAQAALGSTWLYDVTNGIIATMGSTTLQTVFGVLDSVKTISLSTGDTIRLSQNYGLLQWPRSGGGEYDLIGINGRNLGEVLPMFPEFHPFDVGDTLQELHNATSGAFSAFRYSNYKTRKTITNRTQNGNIYTFAYDALELRRTYNYYSGSTVATTQYSDSWIEIDVPNHLSNAYPNQLLAWDTVFAKGADRILFTTDGFRSGTNPVDPTDTRAYAISTVSRNSAGRVVKGVLDTEPFCLGTYTMFKATAPDYYLEGTEQFDSHDYVYESEVGMRKHLNFSCLVDHGLDAHDWTLDAFRIGNLQEGTICPDSLFFVSREPILEAMGLKIFPNPVTDFVQLETQQEHEFAVELMNLAGQSLLQTQYQGKKLKLDLSTYPKGMYLLKIGAGENVVVRKISLQ